MGYDKAIFVLFAEKGGNHRIDILFQDVLMLKPVSFYISLISILPFLLFGCNSATQQTEKAASQAEASETTEAPTPSSTEVSNTVESPNPVESAPAVASAKKIAPGEMFKLAFDNKARVELIRVNRIENRESGKKDLINIQYQVRKIDDGVADKDNIYADGITGRNIEDSSTYKVLFGYHSNRSIELKEIKKNVSVGAYAWMNVPEGVKSIEITIPGVEPFKDVPIEEWQEQAVKTSEKFEPGKFIQPSFENRAKVELLQVNRVKSGDSKGRVHVRFRISRVGDKIFNSDILIASHAVGSNIDTNESYKGYSTESLELAKLEKGKSIEGSILMEMPDDVHSFNLNMPSTQAFKNVPID